MADIYTCPKCGETYFVDIGEDDTCTKCKVKLVPTCEWCGKPEKDCRCGKDEIIIEQSE